MKKIITLIILCFSLVLLLGSVNSQLNMCDVNSISGHTPAPSFINRTRILDYTVVIASEPNALALKVNDKINEDSNWKPIGGIATFDNNCCQAMIQTNQ